VTRGSTEQSCDHSTVRSNNGVSNPPHRISAERSTDRRTESRPTLWITNLLKSPKTIVVFPAATYGVPLTEKSFWRYIPLEEWEVEFTDEFGAWWDGLTEAE
jgi:hypothetical protein